MKKLAVICGLSAVAGFGINLNVLHPPFGIILVGFVVGAAFIAGQHFGEKNV